MPPCRAKLARSAMERWLGRACSQACCVGPASSFGDHTVYMGFRRGLSTWCERDVRRWMLRQVPRGPEKLSERSAPTATASRALGTLTSMPFVAFTLGNLSELSKTHVDKEIAKGIGICERTLRRYRKRLGIPRFTPPCDADDSAVVAECEAVFDSHSRRYGRKKIDAHLRSRGLVVQQRRIKRAIASLRDEDEVLTAGFKRRVAFHGFAPDCVWGMDSSDKVCAATPARGAL